MKSFDEAARDAADVICDEYAPSNCERLIETAIRNAHQPLAELHDVMAKQIEGYKLGHQQIARTLQLEANRLRGLDVDARTKHQIDQCICVLEGRSILLTAAIKETK